MQANFLTVLWWNRSAPGRLTFAFPLSFRDWFDHEDHHSWKEQRDTVDALDTTGWSRFCGRLSTPFSHHNQMQDKTNRVATTSAGTCLKTNKKKIEKMKINATANTPCSHSWWKANQGGRVICISEECIRPTRGHWPRCYHQDWKRKGSLCNAKERKCESSIPLSNHFSYMALRRGGRRKWHSGRFRPLLTTVWGAFSTSDGQSKSGIKTCGKERDKSRSPNRS